MTLLAWGFVGSMGSGVPLAVDVRVVVSPGSGVHELAWRESCALTEGALVCPELGATFPVSDDGEPFKAVRADSVRGSPVVRVEIAPVAGAACPTGAWLAVRDSQGDAAWTCPAGQWTGAEK